MSSRKKGDKFEQVFFVLIVMALAAKYWPLFMLLTVILILNKVFR